MAKIRKANYLDKFKIKKMISFLDTEIINHYTKVFSYSPFSIIHYFLPLRWKFLSETYVIEEDRKIAGVITLTPTIGNPFKMEISRLYLEQDCFNLGKQLIDFIITKYGAKGVSHFIASINSSYDELLTLFVDDCHFRQCSSEQLWKMKDIRLSKNEHASFRAFKNSDAESISTMFNDSVITHFKYSIFKDKKEYLEPLLKGLHKNYKLRYIIQDKEFNGNNSRINGFLSLITSDNINYILDITTANWYECPWNSVLSFSIEQIMKRQKKFNLFVKVKKYTNSAEELETYLKSNEFECIQSEIILTKDFHKIVKAPSSSQRIIVFSGINENPVFKI